MGPCLASVLNICKFCCCGRSPCMRRACHFFLTDRPAGEMLNVRAVDAWQLGLGLCGFMMFKVAVLGVSLTTPDSAELPARALEKKVQ